MSFRLTEDYKKWRLDRDYIFVAQLHIDKGWLDENFPEGARVYLEEVHRMMKSEEYEIPSYKIRLNDEGKAPWVEVDGVKSEKYERTDTPFDLVRTAEYLVHRTERKFYHEIA